MQESLIRHDSARRLAALSQPHIRQWLRRHCVVDQSSRTTDTALWRAYQETHSLAKTDSTRVPLVFRRAVFITFSTARLAYNTGFGDVERSVIVGIRHPSSAFGFNPLGLPSTVEIQYHVPDTGIKPSLLRDIFKDRIPDKLSIDFETRLTAATVREEKIGLLFCSCLEEDEEDQDRDDLVRLVEGAAASFTVYRPVNLAPRLRDGYSRRTRNHYRNALFTRMYALHVSGLNYAIPSNYAHKWLGGIRRLEGVLANVKSMARSGAEGGTGLFAFLYQERLSNDWMLDNAANGTRIAVGALLAAHCDCHTRLHRKFGSAEDEDKTSEYDCLGGWNVDVSDRARRLSLLL